MRYLAILKDSFREALDCKVLYVLLVLSTIAIGFVATLSFQPLSAEKAMAQFFLSGSEVPLTIVLNVHKPEKMHDRHTDVQRQQAQDMQFLYSLKKVELLHGEPDGPESEYALTISYRPLPAGMNPAGRVNDPQAEAKGVRDIFQEAEEFDYLRVGAVELIENAKKEGEPKLYRVTVQGTPRTLRIWPYDITMFGVVPFRAFLPSRALGFQLYSLAQLVLFFGEMTALLLGVIITSFFIPNMLQKGTVDLLLTKPIHRWLLLLNKYFGGLTFVFLNMAYALGGIWLVLGLRTGLWAHGMLLLIVTVTFFFAILYAISTLVAVVTRSTIAAILVTIAAWVLFFAVGLAHTVFHTQYLVEQDREKRGNPLPESERWGDNAYGQVLGVWHAIMPRTTDLGQMDDMIVFTAFMTGNLADMEKFDTSGRQWWQSLLVSTIWIGIFLGLASLWFSYKDY